MPKDKDKPEKPHVPSAFEAQHVAEAMRQMLGSMMGGIEKLGVDVEGMAAMVPLASAMQAQRKKRGASYKEVAAALKVRQMDIKAIEAGSPSEVDGAILVAYAEWLGMSDSLTQWVGNHPKHAAKMGLGGKGTKAEGKASNVIPFYPDQSPTEGAPKPMDPGEVLPISPDETETPFGGLNLINKLISGDPEVMATLESEFAKFDEGDIEMFDTTDIDELTANPALPATYEFEISLRDVKLRIWRLFRVSNELTLQQFHQVIQAVMGWSDANQYAFEISGARIEGHSALDDLQDDYIEEDDLENDDEEEKVSQGREYQVCDFNLQEKDEIDYEYDFRTTWEHKIVLKKILPADPAAVPVCISGKRGCPPEGSPGPQAYQEMLDALADENHPKRKEWLKWPGRRPDPEKFDLKEVNERLAELPPYWKTEREDRAKDKEDR